MKILVTRRNKVLIVFKPEEIKVDWQKNVFECVECGCQFQLESNDEPKIFARLEECDGGELGVNDFTTYFVFCPEGCGDMVKIGVNPFPSINDYGHYIAYRPGIKK